jgi:hypothetical protein
MKVTDQLTLPRNAGVPSARASNEDGRPNRAYIIIGLAVMSWIAILAIFAAVGGVFSFLF